MNAFQYRDGELYCEDVAVAPLAEEFGTPLWIYSKAQLLHQLGQIQEAFADVEPVICYSVKANSNLTLLRTMNELARASTSFPAENFFESSRPVLTQRELFSQASARLTMKFASRWNATS